MSAREKEEERERRTALTGRRLNVELRGEVIDLLLSYITVWQ